MTAEGKRKNKLAIFFELSSRDKLIFLEAVSLLMLSKLIVLFVPLRKVAPHLGQLNLQTREVISEHNKIRLQKIKRSILAGSNNVPWRSVCLDQALACIMMLSRRKIPYSLYLGTMKNEARQKLDAHAWVVCGDEILLGGQKSKQFTIAAFFTRSFT